MQLSQLVQCLLQCQLELGSACGASATQCTAHFAPWRLDLADLEGGVCPFYLRTRGTPGRPSPMPAATGCPRYELSGGLAGWAVRVRLGEALGGCLLTSTVRCNLYQPVW